MSKFGALGMIVFVGLAGATACSAEDGEINGSESNLKQDQEAACSDATKTLNKAIDAAERRKKEVCGEDTMLSPIAKSATRAILNCPALKSTIKSSDSAEPLREALKESLTLRSLTGELLVLADSQFQNWRGVTKLLPNTMMSTEPQGASGVHDEIHFGKDGVVTVITMELDDKGPKSVTHEGVYAVTTETDVKKPPRLTISYGMDQDAVSITLDLRVRTSTEDPTPIFDLVEKDDTKNADSLRVFSSIVSECDA